MKLNPAASLDPLVMQVHSMTFNSMTPTLYIPPSTVSRSELPTNSQRRVLIMGPPKWGKTYSALTFPNPIIVDFDRGLSDVKQDVRTLPFWNDEWFKKTFPTSVFKCNALVQWVKSDGVQLTEQQTIVIDSLSTLCDALTHELEKKAPRGKDGAIDGFWFWKAWSEWLRDFFTLLCSLRAQLVVICHEQELRDSETGRLLGYKWLLKGNDFSSRMNQFFTDTVRMTRVAKEMPGDKVTTEYKWQIQPDQMFPFCCTRLNTDKKFIPANWSALSLPSGQ